MHSYLYLKSLSVRLRFRCSSCSQARKLTAPAGSLNYFSGSFGLDKAGAVDAWIAPGLPRPARPLQYVTQSVNKQLRSNFQRRALMPEIQAGRAFRFTIRVVLCQCAKGNQLTKHVNSIAKLIQFIYITKYFHKIIAE